LTQYTSVSGDHVECQLGGCLEVQLGGDVDGPRGGVDPEAVGLGGVGEAVVDGRVLPGVDVDGRHGEHRLADGGGLADGGTERRLDELRGVVVNVEHRHLRRHDLQPVRMNEVTARLARLVPGWVTVFGRVYHLGM